MDERLMQMVRLSDALMGADAATARRELHARSYSMTPLGPRLGLVQWVDHTIPLFQARMLLTVPVQACTRHEVLVLARLWAYYEACMEMRISHCAQHKARVAGLQMYRAWQQRHAERASTRGRSRVANGEATSPVPAVTIPNATDVFYSRLNAALEVRQYPSLRRRCHMHTAHEKDAISGVAEAVRSPFRSRWPHRTPTSFLCRSTMAHRVDAWRCSLMSIHTGGGGCEDGAAARVASGGAAAGGRGPHARGAAPAARPRAVGRLRQRRRLVAPAAAVRGVHRRHEHGEWLRWAGCCTLTQPSVLPHLAFATATWSCPTCFRSAGSPQ